MAKLTLIRTDSGKYLLQGRDDPSRNADFSLFDWDGEGGDPFEIVGNDEWELVDGIPTVEYDPQDRDSWWSAQAEIVEAAKGKGIEVPEYAD